jgi:hypothetical protein
MELKKTSIDLQEELIFVLDTNVVILFIQMPNQVPNQD